MKTKLSFAGIYEIVHVASGKRYIGNSRNVSNRFYAHRYALRNDRHFCPYLQNAWNKHGESAFEFRLIERCLDEVVALLAREQVWIDKHSKHLYNSRKFSEQFIQEWYRTDASIETRKKASARMREYRANLKRELICGYCNQMFVTNQPSSNVRFCSSTCRNKARHRSNDGKEIRQCNECGSDYYADAHRDSKFCSKPCFANSIRPFIRNDIIDILSRIVNGESTKSIAEEYKVSNRQIGKIAGGVTYSDIELPDWLAEKINERRNKNSLKRKGFSGQSLSTVQSGR